MNKLEEEKDWRRLCELVARETNSRKLHQLLEQLAHALNGRAKKLGAASAPKHGDSIGGGG
jgi:hypothetical protein